MNRTRLLLGTAGVLLLALIWHWISGWGLVTIHVTDEPLSKVLKSIESQGGITIVTSADPTLPVSLDVDRVPPVEAVDAVAQWLDGNWSVTYVTGSSDAEVAAAMASLSENGRNRDYRVFGGGGGGMMGPVYEEIPDPRKAEWNVTASESGELQTYLDQFAQKTGAGAMVLASWNPSVSKSPKSAQASSAIRDLVKSVNGSVEEVFTLRVWTDDGEPDRGSRTASNESQGSGPPRDWRRDINPDWIAERVQSQIAQLPKSEQTQARAEFDEMRSFWQKMRELPDDQRREEMRKFFDSPAVQEQMTERMMRGESRRSPERRADRYKRYIERKKEMKASS